tara:strand:- start:60 stop:314 length:255 start_codon:yes stop_codon:yes gene_type:complete
MSRKTKINLLLPIKMVGELEQYSKIGVRSQFIEKAIRQRLDNEASFDITDISDRQLMAVLLARMQKRNDAAAEIMCTFLLGELQ